MDLHTHMEAIQLEYELESLSADIDDLLQTCDTLIELKTNVDVGLTPSVESLVSPIFKQMYCDSFATTSERLVKVDLAYEGLVSTVMTKLKEWWLKIVAWFKNITPDAQRYLLDFDKVVFDDIDDSKVGELKSNTMDKVGLLNLVNGGPLLQRITKAVEGNVTTLPVGNVPVVKDVLTAIFGQNVTPQTLGYTAKEFTYYRKHYQTLVHMASEFEDAILQLKHSVDSWPKNKDESEDVATLREAKRMGTTMLGMYKYNVVGRSSLHNIVKAYLVSQKS